MMRLTFFAVLIVIMVTICHGAPWIADDKENALSEGHAFPNEEDRRMFSKMDDNNLQNENYRHSLMERRGSNEVFMGLRMALLQLRDRVREELAGRARQLVMQKLNNFLAQFGNSQQRPTQGLDQAREALKQFIERVRERLQRERAKQLLQQLIQRLRERFGNNSTGM